MNRTAWHRRMLGITASMGVGALAVAGCSSSFDIGLARQAGQGATRRLLGAGLRQGDDPAFTKATGIPVKLDDNSTGPLLTQIEASKNNPNWGLLWVDGATAFAGLDQQGLLLKGFEPSVTWNSLGHRVDPGRQELRPDRRHPDGRRWSTTRPR